MFHDLVSMAFMLAQNSQEKSATIIGLTLFAGFMFFLFVDTLIKGIPLMDKKIKGFASADSLLTAPETRSTSPLRIVRDETYQTNIKGIFPAGEGSGYSSGITTSALDGIRVAYKVIDSIKR